MNLLSQPVQLPVHPSKRHPLTGEPLRAVWVRPDGRVMWPVIGGAEDDDAAAQAAATAKAEADAAAAAAKAAEDEAAAAAAKKTEGDQDLGFPKDTPVAEMKPEQQAAYWKHQARRHETRATEWSKLGKTPAEVQAEMEKLRREQMSDAEKAVADATAKGRADAAAEFGPKMARLAFETALSHVEEDRRKVLIDTIDLSKVLKEDGEVDTAKVKTLVETLAPAGKGQGGGSDIGAGKRTATTGSGVAAGAEMYESRRKKTTTNDS